MLKSHRRSVYLYVYVYVYKLPWIIEIIELPTALSTMSRISTQTRRSLITVIFNAIFVIAPSVILRLLLNTICNLFKLSLFHATTKFPPEEEEVTANWTPRRRTTRNVNPVLRVFSTVLLVLLFAFIIVSSLPGIIISTIFAFVLLSFIIDILINMLSYITIPLISAIGYIYTAFLAVDTVYRLCGKSTTLGQISRMRTPPWPYTVCIAVPGYWYMTNGRFCAVELGWKYVVVDISTTLVIGEIGEWVFEETDSGREIVKKIKLWNKRIIDGMAGYWSEISGSWQENLTRPHSISTCVPKPNDDSSIIQESEDGNTNLGLSELAPEITKALT